MKSLPSPPPAKPLYQHLGCREDATQDDLHEAFVRIAKQHHPDLNGGVASPYYMNACHAYEVLKEPAERAAYDATGVDPGDATGAVRRLAVDTITAIAFLCIAESKGRGNLLEQIRAALLRARNQADTEERRIALGIEKVEAVAANIRKRWKGADGPREAILGMIASQLEKDKQGRSAVAQKREINDLALSMLEGATFDTPADIYDTWMAPDGIASMFSVRIPTE